MKKNIFVIVAIIALSVCLISGMFLFHTESPSQRKYTLEKNDDDIISDAYIILKENNTFEFNYSYFSSTIPTGEYEETDNQIYCYDNSEYELIYVFDIKEDVLSFNAALSSKLPGFSKVEDGSLFKSDE